MLYMYSSPYRRIQATYQIETQAEEVISLVGPTGLEPA